MEVFKFKGITINFSSTERKKVAKKIIQRIDKGWTLTEGKIIAKKAYGKMHFNIEYIEMYKFPPEKNNAKK